MAPRLRSSGKISGDSQPKVKRVKTRHLNWCTADWMRLIKLYRSQGVLWSTKGPKSFLKSRRKSAFQAILKGMERSDLRENHIHDLLSSLKSEYTKHLDHQLRSLERGWTFVPKWPLFEAVDEFLRPSICRKYGWENICRVTYYISSRCLQLLPLLMHGLVPRLTSIPRSMQLPACRKVADSSTQERPLPNHVGDSRNFHTEKNEADDVVIIEKSDVRKSIPRVIDLDAVNATQVANSQNIKTETNEVNDVVVIEDVNISERNLHVIDIDTLDQNTSTTMETTVKSISPYLNSSLSSCDERADFSSSWIAENNNADEVFCSHLRHFLRQVPQGRPKMQMYLDIQQLVMQYL